MSFLDEENNIMDKYEQVCREVDALLERKIVEILNKHKKDIPEWEPTSEIKPIVDKDSKTVFSEFDDSNPDGEIPIDLPPIVEDKKQTVEVSKTTEDGGGTRNIDVALSKYRSWLDKRKNTKGG